MFPFHLRPVAVLFRLSPYDAARPVAGSKLSLVNSPFSFLWSSSVSCIPFCTRHMNITCAFIGRQAILEVTAARNPPLLQCVWGVLSLVFSTLRPVRPRLLVISVPFSRCATLLSPPLLSRFQAAPHALSCQSRTASFALSRSALPSAWSAASERRISRPQVSFLMPEPSYYLLWDSRVDNTSTSYSNTDKTRVYRDRKAGLRWHDVDLFPVCSSTPLYSNAADLRPFEMSGHQVLISSRPSIFLLKPFPNVQTSSAPRPSNHGSLKYSVV